MTKKSRLKYVYRHKRNSPFKKISILAPKSKHKINFMTYGLHRDRPQAWQLKHVLCVSDLGFQFLDLQFTLFIKTVTILLFFIFWLCVWKESDLWAWAEAKKVKNKVIRLLLLLFRWLRPKLIEKLCGVIDPP